MPIFLSLLTLVGVHLLAVASPGPAFVSVIQTSVRNPFRITLMHILGLGLASALWALSALFGMEQLLVRAAGVYRVLQLAGGLYLIWIGVKAWLNAKDAPPTSTDGVELTPARAIRRGFTTNLANPKTMVFFASVFTAVLKPGLPAWVKLTAVGLVVVDAVLWYGAVGLVLSSPKAQGSYARAKAAIERTAGTVMLLFGLKLVWDARRSA